MRHKLSQLLAGLVLGALAFVSCGPASSDPTPSLSECLEENNGLGCAAHGRHDDDDDHGRHHGRKHKHRKVIVLKPVCSPLAPRCAL